MLKMQEQKRPQALCPICRKATEQKWRPFCSKHCADVDLGRWINGAYSMPADEPPAGEESAPANGSYGGQLVGAVSAQVPLPSSVVVVSYTP